MKNFYNESKPFGDALQELLMLHAKGFNNSAMFYEEYGNGITPEATIYISPEIKKTDNKLLVYTPIIKRVSTYRENFESSIMVKDIISYYDIYCMITVYNYPKENYHPVDCIEIQPLLSDIFKNGKMYFDKKVDDFIPGNYQVVVKDEANNDVKHLDLTIVSESTTKIGYLNDEN